MARQEVPVDSHVTRPIVVGLLIDFEVIVLGLTEMLRPFSTRVDVIDVGGDPREGQVVDIVLYDAFAAPHGGEHWSQLIGALWNPRHLVEYGWERNDADASDSSAVIRVSKSLTGAKLVRALEEVHATGTYTRQPETGQETVAGSTVGTPARAFGRQWPGGSEGLTEREAEIVALIATGLSNVEVAARLFLGVNTVKTYIRTAYQKMGVLDRSNAILWAVDHGLRPQRPSR